MGFVTVTILVEAPAPRIYAYLKGRYVTEAFRKACMAAKGHLPPVKCLEEVENHRLHFTVPGRDSLLGFPVSHWTWTYEIEPVTASQSQVTIRYQWPWLLSLFTFWTAKPQAANEAIETVLALQALAFDRS